MIARPIRSVFFGHFREQKMYSRKLLKIEIPVINERSNVSRNYTKTKKKRYYILTETRKKNRIKKYNENRHHQTFVNQRKQLINPGKKKYKEATKNVVP